MPDINSDIQYLKGVGPAYAKKFAKLGIYTIRDLLLHYPRRYIDYSQPYTVVSAPFDVDCCVKATVLQRDPDRRIKGGRMLSHVLAGDDTGMLALSWFNAPYTAEKLEPGTEYYFEGRVGGMMTRREILHPLVRTEAQVAAAPLLPVYGSTEGLPAARLTRCAQLALEYVAQLDDPLPPELLTRYRMPPKADAVRAIHAPRDAADAAAARRRLIFEELYILQLGIFLMRGHGRKITGAPMRELDLAPFWRSLPYAPTGAQRRSAEEICHDLCGQTPMNRLLQGDVGSGKTLVAAAAIWFAAQNGWQSAMLAPTEILARQHAANLADRLEPFGVNVTLLVGGMKAAEKRVALAAIADGRAGLVVGTHAVLTDSVVFKNLGLAIVDEQHRFGVRQRGILAGKANNPHLLVMSATPIPRTLGLLMYGDLDISILDELPPGRKPIKTWFITGKKRRDMYGFLEKQIAAGHRLGDKDGLADNIAQGHVLGQVGADIFEQIFDIRYADYVVGVVVVNGDSRIAVIHGERNDLTQRIAYLSRRHVGAVGHYIPGVEVVELEDVVYHLFLRVLYDALFSADVNEHTYLLLRHGLLRRIRVIAEQTDKAVGGQGEYLNKRLGYLLEAEQYADDSERDLFGRLHGYSLRRKLA